MCGIAGIYNLKNQISKIKYQKDILKKMTDTLIHRGPDDEGFFMDEKVALGHRRLSIIDLSKAGHQPMKRGDLVIVFNGEIYNYIEIRQELISAGYKFKTQTDTEVILASFEEWGEKCLQHFNGMWAFVIYNQKTHDLFAARDRMGVKPFYYFNNRDVFIFASEAKALLAHHLVKPRVNEQRVYDYLICGQLDHEEETFFKGIKELRGGNFLKISKSKIQISKYWALPNQESKLPPKDYYDQFREIFLDSVRLRLRSDVPIGTCLSGGLDSSAIVCAVNQFLKKEGIKQLGEHQITFSAVYADKKIDESKFINIVLRKTQAQKNFVYPSPAGLAKELDDLIYTQDFPFSSTSIYAQWSVFKKAHQKHQKVMLDGQGSDEMLAGYHTFFNPFYLNLKNTGQWLRLFSELYYFKKEHPEIIQQVIKNLFFNNPLFSKYKFKTSKLKNLVYGAYYDYSVFQDDWRAKFTPIILPTPNKNPFKDQSYNLLVNNGLPSLLRYEDRNSMAFSIESRTPFLDYRLVELVYGAPDGEKIHQGQTKWMMRQALQGILPEKIRTRQDKIGFATPEKTWFQREMNNNLKIVFLSDSFLSRPYWKNEKVLQSFEKFLQGEPILYQLFWRLYNTEMWLRRFID